MKKICLALLLSAAFLPAVTIHAQEGPEDIKAQIESLQKVLADMEDESSSETATSEETIDKSDWGKRSTPVPLGEYLEVIDKEYGDDGSFNVRLNFKIVSLTRGEEAYQILVSENQFNDPAPEGLEWAIFDLEAEYVNGSEDYPYSPNIRFDIFDTSGRQVNQSDWGTLDSEFSDIDIFPGVTHTGREVYLVPEGEDFLVSIDLDKLYFFDMK